MNFADRLGLDGDRSGNDLVKGMERDNREQMKDNRNLGIIKAMVWEPSAVETFWNL